MSYSGSDSDDLIVIETTIQSSQHSPAKAKGRFKAKGAGSTVLKTGSAAFPIAKRGQPKKRKITDPPVADGISIGANMINIESDSTKRQGTGLRVKSITLSGQRTPLDSSKTSVEKTVAQENKSNKEAIASNSALSKNHSNVLAKEDCPKYVFTHNVRVGSIDGEDVKLPMPVLHPACPKIDTCTVNHSQKDEKQEEEAKKQHSLEIGALNRFKRLLSMGADTNYTPVMKMPIFTVDNSSKILVDNLSLPTTSKTPKEHSFIQHRLNCLGEYVMKLYEIKEITSKERMVELIQVAEGSETQLTSFMATINDFFEEVTGLYSKEVNSSPAGPVYVYHARGHEVRLECLYQCFISPLLSWTKGKSNTPDTSPLSKLEQPFDALSCFVTFFDKVIGIYRKCKMTCDSILPFKDKLSQIYAMLNHTIEQLNALMQEIVVLINQSISFIWNNASTIYDHFLPHGIRRRAKGPHMELFISEYKGILRSFRNFSTGKCQDLINVTNKYVQLIKEKLVVSLKILEKRQEDVRVKYDDVDEAACRVIFKYKNAEAREWTVGMDDGLDRIFFDLFGKGSQRKLYYDGTKVSRNLTARENGFFSGINYVTLHEDDDLPIKISAGITIQLGPDASRNFCIPFSDAQTVSDLIDKVKKETGGTEEYSIIFNGLLLGPTDKLAGLVVEGDVVDAVVLSGCNFD